MLAVFPVELAVRVFGLEEKRRGRAVCVAVIGQPQAKYLREDSGSRTLDRVSVNDMLYQLS